MAGVSADNSELPQFLQDGIRKTGGLKDPLTLKRYEDLLSARKQIEFVKARLAAEPAQLEALVELLAIQRKNAKAAEIKKEVGTLLNPAGKDKAFGDTLAQAKLLDSAAVAREVRKESLAISTYRSVIQKYPDTAAARYAQTQIDAKP
jgi:hypothetical protein